jgi:hypothetical protein
VAKGIATCKANPYIINQNHIFFKTLLWNHFWIDFNKFYTKTFRIVYILTVYLLIMFIRVASPPSPCINCKREVVTKRYWHLSQGRIQPLFYTFVKNAYAFKDDDCICRMCVFFTHVHVLQKAYKFFTTVIIFCISRSMECKFTWVKWHITIAVKVCCC